MFYFLIFLVDRSKGAAPLSLVNDQLCLVPILVMGIVVVVKIKIGFYCGAF